MQDQDFAYDRGATFVIGGGGRIAAVTKRLVAAEFLPSMVDNQNAPSIGEA